MFADIMIPLSHPERRLCPRPTALALALALALCAPGVPAQNADRRAPASIEADRVEIDRPAGVSRYFGDVVFEQGSLQITGERMTVRVPEGVLQHAEVHGDRASLRQRTEGGQIVQAHARHIDYDASEGVATLNNQAEVVRGDDRFTATHIEYRLDTGRIDAAGGDEGRVRIRIQPNQEDDGANTNDGAGDTDATP